MKGEEEASERMLNEIEASQLSDIEFKTMVVRKLNNQTLRETTRNLWKTTAA